MALATGKAQPHDTRWKAVSNCRMARRMVADRHHGDAVEIQHKLGQGNGMPPSSKREACERCEYRPSNSPSRIPTLTSSKGFIGLSNRSQAIRVWTIRKANKLDHGESLTLADPGLLGKHMPKG